MHKLPLAVPEARAASLACSRVAPSSADDIGHPPSPGRAPAQACARARRVRRGAGPVRVQTHTFVPPGDLGTATSCCTSSSGSSSMAGSHARSGRLRRSSSTKGGLSWAQRRRRRRPRRVARRQAPVCRDKLFEKLPGDNRLVWLQTHPNGRFSPTTTLHHRAGHRRECGSERGPQHRHGRVSEPAPAIGRRGARLRVPPFRMRRADWRSIRTRGARLPGGYVPRYGRRLLAAARVEQACLPGPQADRVPFGQFSRSSVRGGPPLAPSPRRPSSTP